jgi:hypothetical protein
MTCHCSAGRLFFIFKGPCPFNLKTFSILIHFIVALPVNVAASTNFVPHNRNHTGSFAPQAATVVVAACGMPL